MLESKIEYQRPEIEVVVVESNDIICSSTEIQFQGSGINQLQTPGDFQGSGVNQIQSPIDGGILH